jgi:hypothetical protein
MTHSPADVTRQLLIDIGQCSDLDTNGQATGDWPVFESGEPNAPDNIVVVMDYEGPYEGSTQYDGERQGLDAIQIKIRSKTKRVGYMKATTIADLLSLSPQVGGQAYERGVTVEDIRYIVHAYSRIGKVIPLGKESPTSTRRVFVVNVLVGIRQCN